MTYKVYLAPADLVGVEFSRQTWIGRGEDFTAAARLEAAGPEEAYVLAQHGKNTLGWAPRWTNRAAVKRVHAEDPRSVFVGDVISQLGRYDKRDKDFVVRRRGFDRWEPRRDTAQDIENRIESFLSHTGVEEPAEVGEISADQAPFA